MNIAIRDNINGQLIWLCLAIIAGALLATQPVNITLILVFAAIYAILCAITPLAAVTFLLVLAPLRTLIATESAFQLPLDIGQLMLAAFISIWILHHILLRQTRPTIARSPLLWPLLLLVGLFGLTSFTALSLGMWLNEWLKWVQIFIVAALTLTLADGKRWHWLIASLLVAGVANAIIGLYEFLGGSGALHLLINGRFFRAFGTFGQPNPFAGFMGLLAPIAIMTTVAFGLRWWKNRQTGDALQLGLYSLAAILLTIGIFISWSRGSWLGFVTSIVTVIFAIPRRLTHGVVIASTVVAFIAGAWAIGIIPASVIDRISSSTEEFFAFQDVRGVDITPENYPVVERLAHWQAAMNMVTAHPWLGVGIGNYEIAYPHYRLINWDEPLGHAHNYYLNVLAETGIIGLMGYIVAWLVILWLTWRARSHPDILSRFVAIGLFGSWTYLAVHSLFDNLFVNNLFLHIGLMLGITGILYNQSSRYVKLRMV